MRRGLHHQSACRAAAPPPPPPEPDRRMCKYNNNRAFPEELEPSHRPPARRAGVGLKTARNLWLPVGRPPLLLPRTERTTVRVTTYSRRRFPIPSRTRAPRTHVQAASERPSAFAEERPSSVSWSVGAIDGIAAAAARKKYRTNEVSVLRQIPFSGGGDGDGGNRSYLPVAPSRSP